MNKDYRVIALAGICAAILLIGFVFSVRLTAGINHAATIEATQHSAVPTPAALQPKPAPAHS